MKRITKLKICYWCLLIVAGFLLAMVFPKWTLRDGIMSMIIMLCCMEAGYVDRVIDEEKNKLNH